MSWDWDEGKEEFDDSTVSLGLATPIHETDMAVRFECHALGYKLWVPKSQVADESEVWESGQSMGELVVRNWWWEQQR